MITNQPSSIVSAVSTIESVSSLTVNNSTSDHLPQTITCDSSTSETLSQGIPGNVPSITATPVNLLDHGSSIPETSSASINMPSVDHNSAMQVSESSLSSENTQPNRESSFVQLLYPSEDGKSSFYETVEVITVQGDTEQKVTSQTEKIHVDVLNADLISTNTDCTASQTTLLSERPDTTAEAESGTCTPGG
jgi:hypothetical protein